MGWNRARVSFQWSWGRREQKIPQTSITRGTVTLVVVFVSCPLGARGFLCSQYRPGCSFILFPRHHRLFVWKPLEPSLGMLLRSSCGVTPCWISLQFGATTVHCDRNEAIVPDDYPMNLADFDLSPVRGWRRDIQRRLPWSLGR